MRFSQVSVLGLCATSVYAGLIERLQNPRTTGGLSVAEPVLEERQLLNGLKQFGKGIFWFGVAAAAQGGQVWRDMVAYCEEFNKEKTFANGQACVWSALANTWHTAIYAQGSYQTTITVANVMKTGLGAIGGKRAESGNKGWSSVWQSLSTAQKDQFRSQMRDVHHSANFHSIGDGYQSLDDSISVYLHFGTSNSTGPYLRHVTNGTHGFIHPVVPNQQISSNYTGAMKRDTSWGWNNKIAGLKFSYNHPCMGEAVADNTQNNNDYLDSIVAFEQYAAANPFDKWNIEFDDQQAGELIMYGTLVAERDGFDNEYEEPNFNPAGFCHN